MLARYKFMCFIFPWWPPCRASRQALRRHRWNTLWRSWGSWKKGSPRLWTRGGMSEKLETVKRGLDVSPEAAKCYKAVLDNGMGSQHPSPNVWAPRPPELQQWKNLIWCTVENVEDFSWYFLRPFSLEIEGQKSSKNFAKISPHFSPISSKNFARTSLWGIAGTTNVKNLWDFKTQIWLEIITSRDAQSACFKGSQTSCTEVISCLFFSQIWPKKITSRDGCVLLMESFWSRCRGQ